MGDIHLEKLNYIFPDQDHLQPIFRSIDYAKDYAVSHGIKHFIQGGDIFEYPNPAQTTQVRFLANLRRKRKAPLQEWYIRGNHDYSEHEEHATAIFKFFTQLDSNVSLFLSPEIVEIEGVPVCFLPYPYTKPEATKYQKLVIAHQEFDGALRDNGMIIKDHKKFKSRDQWLLGHLHTYQSMGNALFSGTMLQYNFGEGLKKGFLHCHATFKRDKLTLEHQFIPYDPPYQLINLHIKTKKDLELVEASNSKFYKLFLQSDIPVPTEWSNDFPNVLYITPYKSKKELQVLKEGKLLVEENLVEIKPTEFLDEYLKNQGFNASEIKQGCKVVDKIIKSLGK
jgi:DNA repair exonuclease SbcCD nuclease subunit